MGAIAEIPQDCLSLILSWTSPVDASKLACVSHYFAEASRSNVTWQNLLPSDFRNILVAANLHSLSPNPSPSVKTGTEFVPDCDLWPDKRVVFQRLSRGVLLNNGQERYVLLKRSRGACRSLSCSAMDIAGGNDTRFWRWEESRSSCFPKVAHLIAVCRLAVSGKWECTLPADKYSVCWRLKVVNPRGGQMHFLAWKKPLKFHISYMGVVVEKELHLLHLPSDGFQKWFEFEAGQVEVKGKKGEVVAVKLEFGMEEIDCSFWKGGLFLDCVTLRPSQCVDVIYDTQPDKQLASIRGRPGVF